MGYIGNIIAVSFFVALAFAGITSAVSIVEPTVLYLINRFSLSRAKALAIVSVVTYIFGVMAIFSNVKAYASYFTYFGKGYFDILDYLSSAILLPLGGMIIAVFVGFVMDKQKVYGVLSQYMSDRVFNLWYFSVKFIAPTAVTIVMIIKLFLVRILKSQIAFWLLPSCTPLKSFFQFVFLLI
jgi:Na+-dependent transporters of the SNF family